MVYTLATKTGTQMQGIFPSLEDAERWHKEHLPTIELVVKPLLIESWMESFFEDFNLWTRDAECTPIKKVN